MDDALALLEDFNPAKPTAKAWTAKASEAAKAADGDCAAMIDSYLSKLPADIKAFGEKAAVANSIEAVTANLRGMANPPEPSPEALLHDALDKGAISDPVVEAAVRLLLGRFT